MQAQLSFLDGTFSLIHIPLDLYPILLQPILRVLLPQPQSLDIPDTEPEFEIRGLTPGDFQHVFFNVSITPIECSVVCHSSWATHVFQPLIDKLHKDQAEAITISTDTYMVLSVISAGLDAAGRVMELSSPLALAGVPIFFITTYYSDFILVPTKERETVIEALSTKGFQLLDQNNFINPSAFCYGNTPPDTSPPGTPRPSSVSELQDRTFELLQKRNVKPFVAEGLQLVQCSGREINQLAESFMHRASIGRKSSVVEAGKPTWIDGVDPKLYTRLVCALASYPRFLSITLAQEDPPSILLDRKLLPLFGDSLIGDMDSKLTPIFLDLVSLPFEVTGIVCGVAGKLVSEMQMTETAELCYLSTARASAVILPEEQATQARAILEPIFNETAEATEAEGESQP